MASAGTMITADILRQAGPDPLRVLTTCAPVVNAMTSVRIDRDAIEQVAAQLVRDRVPLPEWDTNLHFQGTGDDALEQTIGWIFALDALNFCFWGQGRDPAHRWRITSGGQVHDGYIALALALRDAARAGVPVWDAHWLANVDEATVARLLAPAPGAAEIPLFAARVANLRELGQGLLARDAGPHPATAFVEACRGSAPALALAVASAFPSFDDVADWHGTTVRFYKRAQILASDLAGALEDLGGMVIGDRDQLTAFADYKVPQVLRQARILAYDASLAEAIHRRALISAGSREEIEIRAATVWACELLRQALADAGERFTAADVDWLLWNLGQSLPHDVEPYHRTITIFY